MPIDTTAPLDLMISSRCATRMRKSGGGAQPLSTVRERAKQRLESLFSFQGERLFDVWINEDERNQTADLTWYRASEERARASDIVLVLFSGDSGSRSVGDLGVCHAELEAAMADTPTKVRVIDVRPAVAGKVDLDERFVNDVEGRSLIVQTAGTADEILERVCSQALAALRTLARHGLLEVRRRSKAGGNLAWDRLAFDDRKRAMEYELAAALAGTLGAGSVLDGTSQRGVPVVGDVGGHAVLFVCHAAPAGLSVAASREMVGQPFLHDHDLARLLAPGQKRRPVGPAHVIASPQAVTEPQARRLLGFPDATVVKDTWGVWVTDGVQRIQLLLVDRCTDAVATRARVQQAVGFLDASGEGRTLVERAGRRRAIVLAIAGG
ncbi:MAG TPA: hypothetical protein VFJ85_03365 [Acidimicrobiales bacterium]|nr:hypothetical protein [Acidimicrobiales bacterium]